MMRYFSSLSAVAMFETIITRVGYRFIHVAAIPSETVYKKRESLSFMVQLIEAK